MIVTAAATGWRGWRGWLADVVGGGRRQPRFKSEPGAPHEPRRCGPETGPDAAGSLVASFRRRRRRCRRRRCRPGLGLPLGLETAPSPCRPGTTRRFVPAAARPAGGQADGSQCRATWVLLRRHP